jgi:signal transduction histidine kinase
MVLRMHDELQLYKDAFDLDLTGKAFFDSEGRWLRVNASLCRILDRSVHELRAGRVTDLFPQVADCLAELKADPQSESESGTVPVSEASADADAPMLAASFVCAYTARDDSTQWLQVSVTLHERRIGMLQVQDNTEREQSMQLLVQSEKLTAAGQLAAGIAHEIRNPLTSLKGFLHLLKANNGNPAKHDAYVTIMNDELNRIDQILSELLVLSKPQSVQFIRRRPAAIVQQVLEILQPQAVLKNVQLLVSQLDETVTIYCDENQIKQVLINLVKNGIEAMPDGGRIWVGLLAERERVILSVADEGAGIPEEVLNRIGEPFYTTKEKGTGLGLMVSFKIIENHGGTIQIESSPDRGTLFTITLPRAGQQPDDPGAI